MSFLIVTQRTRLQATALLVLVAGVAGAQDVRVGWVASRYGQELLGTTTGFGVGVTGATHGRFAFRLSYTGQTSDHHRRGIACAGLIPPPPACPQEDIEDHSNLRELALSVDVAHWQLGEIGPITPLAGFFVGVQGARVEADSRGTSTGNALTAERARFGAHAGYVMSFVPRGQKWLRPFVAIEGALYTGPASGLIDGYTPFDDSFASARMTLGLQFSFADR